MKPPVSTSHRSLMEKLTMDVARVYPKQHVYVKYACKGRQSHVAAPRTNQALFLVVRLTQTFWLGLFPANSLWACLCTDLKVS